MLGWAILLLGPLAHGARSYSSHEGTFVCRWLPNCCSKGRYNGRASDPAILLISRTIALHNFGQSLPDITALHFLLLVQLPQRRLPTRTWHTHYTRLSLSGAHHFVFSLKDNTSPREAKRNLFPSKEVSGDAVSLT